MNKESLEKAREIITEALLNGEIIPPDKMEIINNTYQFLNPKEYKENVKVLSMKNAKNKFRK